jgi:hypothetical protein
MWHRNDLQVLWQLWQQGRLIVVMCISIFWQIESRRKRNEKQ